MSMLSMLSVSGVLLLSTAGVTPVRDASGVSGVTAGVESIE